MISTNVVLWLACHRASWKRRFSVTRAFLSSGAVASICS